ncbi:hypothetical protein FA95DRAFT_1199372 [Auriscalpium vulgare]|uniref:Uncharacterized protein n=1 Tax=Auriscalpium vulgare TaxID=40419 RepID=A0ACB8RTU1_9AGAM|nr:hypothetical protein FA95DRAFT_1199372 [Auriscalpium vulgare]
MIDSLTPTDSQSTLSEPDVEGSWLRDLVARVVADSQVTLTDRIALETEATLGVLALVRQELIKPSSIGGHRGIDEDTQTERLRRREEAIGWREEELKWKVTHAERRELHARMRDDAARSRDDESRQHDEDVKKREREVVLTESGLTARKAALDVQEDAARDKLRRAEETEQRVQDRSGEIAEAEAALAEREAAVRAAEEEILTQRETVEAEEAKARDSMAAAERMLRDADQLFAAAEGRQKALEEREREVATKTADVEQREQSLMTRELEAAQREESVLTRQTEAAQREEILIRRQKEVVGREEKALHRERAVAVREADALPKDAAAEKSAGVREPAGADATVQRDPEAIETDVVVVDDDDSEMAEAALESDSSAPPPAGPAEDVGTVKTSDEVDVNSGSSNESAGRATAAVQEDGHRLQAGVTETAGGNQSMAQPASDATSGTVMSGEPQSRDELGSELELAKASFEFSRVDQVTFCGDWAGNSCATSGCPGTCTDRLTDPGNFVARETPVTPALGAPKILASEASAVSASDVPEFVITTSMRFSSSPTPSKKQIQQLKSYLASKVHSGLSKPCLY